MDEQLLYSWQFSAQCLQQLGVDIHSLFQRHGLAVNDLQGANSDINENQISMAIWYAILDDVAASTGDIDIGLKACRNADFSGYGPIGFAMLSADTLGQGLDIICHYIDLVRGETDTRVVAEDKNFAVTFRSHNLEHPVHRVEIDWNLSFALYLIRYCLGQDWRPLQVDLMYGQPADISVHTAIIGAPVHFGAATNKILVTAETLATPMPKADHRLCDILCRDLDRLLALQVTTKEQQDELLDGVRTEIGKILCIGAPKIEEVAKRLNTSSRSLQRRLSEKGYSFKSLVEDTRRHLAESYIRSTTHSLTDIAFMLGYSEISAFTRAFRRWCGVTPQQFRKQT